MSEKLKTNHESSHEQEPNYERLELPTAKEAEPLRRGEKDPALALAEARQDVLETTQAEKQPNPMDKLEEAEDKAQAPAQTHINLDLKKATLQRELTQIRRHLSAPQRTLSKVIHQPVVRVVSEAAGKTVSRPSGLLGGSIMAFVGTSGYFFLAANQGFKYNYVVFLALFLGGFALGLIIELLVWTATRSRRHASR